MYEMNSFLLLTFLVKSRLQAKKTSYKIQISSSVCSHTSDLICLSLRWFLLST